MTPFFSIGKSSGCYVVSKTLYEAKKADNSLYSLERLLSPGGSAKLCTVFSCPEPFITSVLPDKKEEGRAEKLIFGVEPCEGAGLPYCPKQQGSMAD